MQLIYLLLWLQIYMMVEGKAGSSIEAHESSRYDRPVHRNWVNLEHGVLRPSTRLDSADVLDMLNVRSFP